MATTMIGLDLGLREVRAWQLEVSFSKRESKASLRRPVELLEGEERLDAQLRTAAELLDREGLGREAYALAIPRSITSVLTHRLPSAQLKMLDEILPGELEDLLPFDSDDLFYDYQVSHRGEQELELLIVYTLRSEFDDFMRRCTAVGLDPKVVTLGGIYAHNLILDSVHNTAEDEASSQRDLEVLLDIGESGAEWVIYQGERLFHIQRADVGGGSITSALSETFRVDEESAEQGKLSEARWMRPEALNLIDDANGLQLASAFNRVIEESLAPLLGELGRSFAYCERIYGMNISKVHITGGGSRLKGIGQLISDRLMVRVVALSPQTEMLPHLSSAEVDGVHDYLAFAMAHGLAKRLHVRTINLRKSEHQYSGDSGLVRGLVIALMLTLLAVAGLQGSRIYVEHESARAELIELEREVSDLGQRLFGSEGMELDTIKAKVESAKKAKVLIPDVSVLSVLKDLSTYIEKRDGLELDNLSINLKPSGRGSLMMKGKAGTIGDVSMIISAVKKSSCFAERVKKEKVTKAIDDRKSFHITSSSTCQ